MAARPRNKRIGRVGWRVGLVWLAAAGSSWAADVAEDVSPAARPLVDQLQAKDPVIRYEAFLRLEALRDPATSPVVREYLTSRDASLRALSVRALAAIEGAAAIPTLLEQLQQDRHYAVRLAAVLALEPWAGQDLRVLEALLRAVTDRRPEVRMAAADALSRVHDPRARDAIHRRWKRERNRDVRRVLERAVARVGESP